MSLNVANEPLSDDLDMNSPYYMEDAATGGNAMPSSGDGKPGDAPAMAETANMDASSETGSDALQWGYKPRSRLGEFMNHLVPHGGAISNVYNMCAVTLGSGIFSLPYAFKCSGVAVAIVVLVAISLSTVYSVYIMVQAVEKTRALAKAEMANKLNHHTTKALGSTSDTATVVVAPSAENQSAAVSATATDASAGGEKKGTLSTKFGSLNEEGNSVSPLFLCSYEQLSRGLLGRGWDYFAAFNMWFFCFGSCVSYVITVNDLISTALKSSSTGEPKTGWLYTNEWGSKVLTIVVWAVLMLPLSIPKQINSLRYGSVITVMFIVYFSIVVIVHACQNSFYTTEDGHVRSKNTLRAAESGNNAINGFSMFLFAFLLQTNVLQLQKEAVKPSAKRMTAHTGVATGLCTSLYILVGIFGLLEFSSTLEGTILRQYNLSTEPAIAVGYVLLGFKLSVSFAICMLPSRDSVYYCIGTNVRTIRTAYHVVLVVFMSVVALILGLVIPDVEIIFSLVGSFAGGFLGFIFPALFIMYAGNWGLRQVGWFHYFATYALLIAGVISVCFGTAVAIWAIV